MIVYRIANPRYSNDLSGTGAKLYGARWNSVGVAMLYTSSHLSLALLEMLVHTHFEDYATRLDLVQIEVPDAIPFREIKPAGLKKNWQTDPSYTRFIGDEFAKSLQAALLKVPSAVIPEEFNFLANPLHSDFKRIRIIGTTPFHPDQRLLHAHE